MAEMSSASERCFFHLLSNGLQSAFTKMLYLFVKQRRETGHVVPKAIPGRPAKKGVALQAGLREQLEKYPDATREEHCRMWEERTGVRVSPASISRARAALGWTRKKRR